MRCFLLALLAASAAGAKEEAAPGADDGMCTVASDLGTADEVKDEFQTASVFRSIYECSVECMDESM